MAVHFCVIYPSESGPYLFIISSLGGLYGQADTCTDFLGARFAILLHVMSFFLFVVVGGRKYLRIRDSYVLGLFSK